MKEKKLESIIDAMVCYTTAGGKQSVKLKSVFEKLYL